MNKVTLQGRERSETSRRERISLRLEKRLQHQGYRKVVGVDEVGRGPLAGPVVACAVRVNLKRLNCLRPDFSQIRDSKKLSAQKRARFCQVLINHPAIEWGIGKVSERVIDRINILEATKLAMIRAVQRVEKPNFLILDGKIILKLKTPQKSIVKADEKVFSCAAASIIAKVYRDRIMQKQHQKYSQYGFSQHKGYPTKFHRQMLKKYGSSKIHRQTFRLT